MPMIGTATRAHGTVCEHPSDWFWVDVNTSKSALPVPFRPVTPNVSLLGRPAPPLTSTDSGGSPAQPALPP